NRVVPDVSKPLPLGGPPDYLGKFDEKDNDGYFLGYSLVSKAFRVFNTKRKQNKETYHITFDESTDAINFTKPSDDNITIVESEGYPPDEFLHLYESSKRGIEFLNKTLNAFFKEEGIKHQTFTARTPEQNGIVKRRNRTLVKVAQTMLLASQLPLFFWAEAIATACYTQNRSIIIPTHGKTPYHIIIDRKCSIKHLYIFGCICDITRDGENLDKMKEKRDQCILVGCCKTT
nr:retrovirus-related Pol polyprotein from transposon TNT 1-94 [Tanacetum cinerariifolium]